MLSQIISIIYFRPALPIGRYNQLYLNVNSKVKRLTHTFAPRERSEIKKSD